ncbi:MAG: sigma-70 family RNA polymerase sigma factor [Myxococcales bacterium]|nr:sigma-70 family RNA polymerase sigma factor [Myxococcales bacterium]
MSDRDATEAELRALIDGGDLDGATDRALRAWGPEIYGWLSGVLADPTEAADGFAVFAEQLWQSLRRYDGRCSTRTWCYMLARHAASRVREARRRGAAVPLSQAPDIAAAVRTITAVHQQSAVKDELRALRASLPEEDQMLLVLRVDRELGWREVAQILGEEDAPAADLERRAAALRKRFERVKAELRKKMSAR